MSLTVKGGKSPRQNAAIRGRDLIREELQRQRDFKALQRGGNNPKAPKTRLGPLLRS